MKEINTARVVVKTEVVVTRGVVQPVPVMPLGRNEREERGGGHTDGTKGNSSCIILLVKCQEKRSFIQVCYGRVRRKVVTW